MNKEYTIGNLGEVKIIKIIEELIFEKTGKRLIRDDSFFFPLNINALGLDFNKSVIVFNTDMLVSSTDVPDQMSYYNVGRKAILMNISDLIVKAVKPKGIFVSLGLFKNLKVGDFKELMNGIIDYCVKWNIDYIGGDTNETKELIINPGVFGIQEKSKIIYRNGTKPGDLLVINKKFGLTGVGFDILLNKKSDVKNYPKFKRSIASVLEPFDLGNEAFYLSEKNLATASIDSSDGLAKSLYDLIESNQDLKIGFEIDFNDDLIDEEAKKYSQEFNISLEKLVFNGGEEFVHLFTINPKNYEQVTTDVQKNGGNLFKVGKVISDKKVYFIKENKKNKMEFYGFEHFK